MRISSRFAVPGSSVNGRRPRACYTANFPSIYLFSTEELRTKNSKSTLRSQGDDQARNHQVRYRQWKQELPAKIHQLVITEARQCATNPDVEKQESKDSQPEPENRENSLQPVRAENRSVPSAQKQKRRQAGNRDHVGILGHKEHGEFHGAVFGVITSHQFGFSFRQIKGHAVGFCEGRHQVNKKRDSLPAKYIPTRDETPEITRLRVDDFAQAETAGYDQYAHQRQPEGNFIAHHLRACPQTAQQGILAVRRPPGQGHSINAHRGDAENNQQANIDVRDLKRCMQSANRNPIANWNNGDRGQSQDERDHRGCDVKRFIYVRGRQVLFEDELNPVGKWLQQPKRSNIAWPPPVLDVADNFTFQPDGVGHRRQQHKDCDQGFNERNQYEYSDAHVESCLLTTWPSDFHATRLI